MQLCVQQQAQLKLPGTKESQPFILKYGRQAVRDQELRDQAHRQLFARWQDSDLELSVLKKLHQFRMTARDDLAAEEEEESKLNFPSLLTEKLK
jgi:hypothetical protein